MYWLLILTIPVIGFGWYLAKQQREKDLSERTAKIRDALRGKEFYVDIKNNDGTPTPYELTIIDWLKQFGAVVFDFPDGVTALPRDSNGLLVKGTFGTTRNPQNMGEELVFNLKLITSNLEIIGARPFKASADKEEELLLSIMWWIAHPVTITAI